MPLVTYGKKKPLYVVPKSSSSASGPLASASRSGDLETMRSIIESDRTSLQAVDADGNTPLHIAAYNNREAATELLLAQMPEINARNNKGETSLYIAASRGYAGIVRMLLNHGADAGAKDNDGKSPLMLVAASGDKNIVEILLENHADPNAADNAGDTPLAQAAAKGNVDIVKALLDRGADANKIDKSGNTPLYAAAGSMRQSAEIASLLLAHGADVNAVSANGETALYRAANRQSKSMVDVLLANHALNGPATLKGANSAAEIMTTLERKAIAELRKANRSAAMANVVGGGAACTFGIVATAFGYSLASSGSGGGVYFVFWGAIIFGGWRFLKGLGQLMTG